MGDIASPSSSQTRLYLPTTRRHIWWATGGASAILFVFQLWVVFRTDEPLDFASLVLAVFVLWCLIYLPLTWRALVMTDAASLATWAKRIDDLPRSPVRDMVFGRTVGFAMPVSAAVTGFAAGAYILPHADALNPTSPSLLRVLSVLAVVLSWLLVHTAFATHYAYVFQHGGGMNFPEDTRPAPMDFAYFSAAVATTFGTTDVNVTSSRVRRIVLGHSLLSFAFNTGVLALTLTLLFT